MKRRSGLVIGLMLLVAAGLPALAQDAVPIKQKFVADLQNALRTNDTDWLAARMRFPVRYFSSQRETTMINNKTQFVRNYRTYISAKVRDAVLAQNATKVFESWQGLMVGTGSFNIWVRDTGDGPDGHYQIITINDAD